MTRDGSLVVAMGEASEVTSFATEKDITEALVRLANPEARKVYFLVGHGERDLQSAEAAGFGQVRAALESKNYEVASLNLVSQASVPADARARSLSRARPSPSRRPRWTGSRPIWHRADRWLCFWTRCSRRPMP